MLSVVDVFALICSFAVQIVEALRCQMGVDERSVAAVFPFLVFNSTVFDVACFGLHASRTFVSFVVATFEDS